MKAQLFVLVLLLCSGCGREPNLEGGFVGRTYVNSVFGFSFMVPENWVIAERGQVARTVEGSAKQYPSSFDKQALAKATPKATQLLWIAPPGQVEHTRTFLSFTAYDVSDSPTLPSAADFAASSSIHMSRQPFVSQLTGPKRVEFGGRSFHRTDLIRQDSVGPVNQTYLLSGFGDKMLIVLISGTNANDHAQMEALLNDVAFEGE